MSWNFVYQTIVWVEILYIKQLYALILWNNYMHDCQLHLAHNHTVMSDIYELTFI